jgi:hypothetical protein
MLDTGYPSNATFTKLSSTSLLEIHLNGDFTTGPSPDVLFLGLTIDGVLEENAGLHVANAAAFMTISWSKITRIGSPFAAGDYTLSVQVGSASGATLKTFRSSNAVDFQIIEYELAT